ncbi:MAG: hypothetical protein KHW87_01640 [Clostridiales bacterium]|nr:hypothetical protein [Clostridiales bacterium]
MFEINAVFKYGASGIYRLREIKQANVTGETKEYYVLQSVSCATTSTMIPADNPVLTDKMYPILTEEQARALLDRVPTLQTEWIINDKDRAATFKTWMESDDRAQIFAMVKAIRAHRKEFSEKGKKLRSADEITLNRAEKLLFEEIHTATGITPDAFYALLVL